MSAREPLPAWQERQLLVLLDALGPVPAPADELSILQWIAGKDADVVGRVARLLRRARVELTETCPGCGRDGHAVPQPAVAGRVECAVCSAVWTPRSAATRPAPTWLPGDPDPRWWAGDWAVRHPAATPQPRVHPARTDEVRSVALEYGREDHIGWLYPAEARALAAALLAAAAWSPGDAS